MLIYTLIDKSNNVTTDIIYSIFHVSGLIAIFVVTCPPKTSPGKMLDLGLIGSQSFQPNAEVKSIAALRLSTMELTGKT